MKSVFTLALSLLSLVQAAPPTANGTRFSVDGETRYFAGTNSYWIGFLTNNCDVDTVLDHISSSGLKILRIWGFNDVTGKPASGISAEKRGVKLIINFVNNWSDYGGMPAYVTAFGGSKESWYTNSRAQAQYKAYIAAVVKRYINSSAVFAWELANEPRCKGCSTGVIYKWATDISAYVRSLDRNHMIILGDEGFGLPGATSYPYQTSEGVDFVKNLAIKDLDFGTFHFYPQSWGLGNAAGAAWIKDHASACKKAGKPCLFEEYGTSTDHCTIERPWQQASLQAATEGMAADLFWQWGDTLGTGQTHNDGNTIYYGSADATCLITEHVRAINSL
ncbi:glycoside hydrolase superfamily [Pseudoneurospora amorphoporcata]|uniref:mannan endo-1,4-beta-mannosidase n=1 Tax=Pseudoneurospora amorphoporcata TaxID=241081 RepID=A0AAN6P0T8_9PEZI|nr:glycoside hydrolase superfamily [Pseudoneurospora amorphoporcata]